MKIILKKDWDIPLCPPLEGEKTEGHFVGRMTELKRLVNEIQRAKSGAISVSGYRGVGKTSLVYKALSCAKQQETMHLFCWDSPEDGKNRHLNHIKAKYNIQLTEKAKFKTEFKTIFKTKFLIDKIILKDEGNTRAKIEIDRKKNTAHLNIDGDKEYDLEVKKENGKLNIYSKNDLIFVFLNAAQLEAESVNENIDPKNIIENLIRRLYSATQDIKLGKINEAIEILYLKAVASEFEFTKERSEKKELSEELVKTISFKVDKKNSILISSWALAILLPIFLQVTNIIPWNLLNNLVPPLLVPVPYTFYYMRESRHRESKEIKEYAKKSYKFDNRIGNLEFDLENIHRRISQYGKKLIYVIDELDKLEINYVKDVVKFYKNLFTLSNALFIFIGGEKFYNIGECEYDENTESHQTTSRDLQEKKSDVDKAEKDYRPKEYTYFTSKYFLSRPLYADLDCFFNSIFQTEYLFGWDEISENDDKRIIELNDVKRIIEFLKDVLKIEWAKPENISIIDDDKTIIISNKEKSLSLELNNEKTKVNLIKIDDDRVDEFTVKTENGKRNIYLTENLNQIEKLKRALSFEANNDFFDLKKCIKDRITDFDGDGRPIIKFKKLTDKDIDKDIEKERFHKVITNLFEDTYMSSDQSKWKDNEYLHRKLFSYANELISMKEGDRISNPADEKSAIIRDLNEILEKLNFLKLIDKEKMDYERTEKELTDPKEEVRILFEFEEKFINKFEEYNNYILALNNAFTINKNKYSHQDKIFNKFFLHASNMSFVVKNIKNWEFDTQKKFEDNYEVYKIIENKESDRNKDEIEEFTNKLAEHLNYMLANLPVIVSHMLIALRPSSNLITQPYQEVPMSISSFFDKMHKSLMQLNPQVVYDNDEKSNQIVFITDNIEFFGKIIKENKQILKKFIIVFITETITDQVKKLNLYLFSWDEIPGNDNVRLIKFLKQNFGIDWAKTAKIEKIDNGKTIKVSTQKNYLSLKLNDEQTEVNLEIDDVRTDKFVAKIENSKLNIYLNLTVLNILTRSPEELQKSTSESLKNIKKLLLKFKKS